MELELISPEQQNGDSVLLDVISKSRIQNHFFNISPSYFKQYLFSKIPLLFIGTTRLLSHSNIILRDNIQNIYILVQTRNIKKKFIFNIVY